METSSVVRYLENTPVNAFAFMPEPRVAARTFRDLLVWQKAHQFVLGVYSFHRSLPQAGDLWAVGTKTLSGGVYSRQYRRRVPAPRQSRQSRQSTLHEHR